MTLRAGEIALSVFRRYAIQARAHSNRAHAIARKIERRIPDDGFMEAELARGAAAEWDKIAECFENRIAARKAAVRHHGKGNQHDAKRAKGAARPAAGSRARRAPTNPA